MPAKESAWKDKEDWILTYTGKQFRPLDPEWDMIDIVDIAHALSNTCRFTGHTNTFYSVAQHSYLVSLLCDDHQLYGLLHDASEAYLCDISTPVKKSAIFRGYREAEQWLQGMILLRYGIRQLEMPKEVKGADKFMGIWEGVSFMPECEGAFWTDNKGVLVAEINYAPLNPWSPKVAEEKFITRFDKLYRA